MDGSNAAGAAHSTCTFCGDEETVSHALTNPAQDCAAICTPNLPHQSYFLEAQAVRSKKVAVWEPQIAIQGP